MKVSLCIPSVVQVAMLVACGGDPTSLDVADSDTDTVEHDVDATPDTTPDTDEVDTADGAQVEPSVRIVSLNLRCLIDDWDKRLPILADGLAAVDPELLGLQEACEERGVNDNLTELVAALSARTGRTYAVHRAVTHRAWDRYDEGLAIVSALPLTDLEAIALPGGIFPRKLLLARASLPSGETLAIGTTHLDHQSAPSRKLQAQHVATATDTYTRNGEAFVLTGDFNEGPTAGEVHTTLAASGLVDLWALLNAGDPGPTFTSANPQSRIDAVWLDATTSGLVGTSIVRILTTAVGGVYGSDHLGLAATLTP